MIEKQKEIEAVGAEVLLIAYDQPSLLSAKMLVYLAVPYLLLLDPTKAAYSRWGMGRTNLWRSMLSPALTWRYIKLLAKGERFLGLAPDMYQLGGDFVIGRKGEIAFAYRMTTNGNRASIERLLAELQRVASDPQSSAASG